MFLSAGHLIPKQQQKRPKQQQQQLPAVWEKLLVSESLCKTVSISIATTTTAAPATSSVRQSVERLTEEQTTGLCLVEKGEEDPQRPTQDEDLHPSVSELPGLDLQLVIRAAVRNQQQHLGKVWSAARGLAEGGPEDQVEGFT